MDAKAFDSFVRLNCTNTNCIHNTAWYTRAGCNLKLLDIGSDGACRDIAPRRPQEKVAAPSVAAPDLLEALKGTVGLEALKDAVALMHEFFDGEQCDHGANICYCGVRETMDQADAAIAWAEAQP